jgi:uncharacterized protein with PIN domain
MNCKQCNEEMELVDVTYSYVGETMGMHSGDIYECPECEIHFIDDFINKVVRRWEY